MLRAVRAVAFGVRAVLGAPAIVLLVYAMLWAVVLPGAAALTCALEHAFDQRIVERELPGRADAQWFARAGQATAAMTGESVSPRMLGFAGQLSNLEDLVEARPRGAIALASLVAWSILWTLILGGVLRRFTASTALGIRAFASACARVFLPFLLIIAVTLTVYALCVLVYRSVPSGTRVFVIVPLALVAGVTTVIASYARARVALAQSDVAVALAWSVRVIRQFPLMVATHAAIAVVLWAALIVVVAAIDVSIGAGTGLWRALAVGQAYAFGRIVSRLIWEASALAIVRTVSADPSPLRA